MELKKFIAMYIILPIQYTKQTRRKEEKLYIQEYESQQYVFDEDIDKHMQ